MGRHFGDVIGLWVPSSGVKALGSKESSGRCSALATWLLGPSVFHHSASLKHLHHDTGPLETFGWREFRVIKKPAQKWSLLK